MKSAHIIYVVFCVLEEKLKEPRKLDRKKKWLIAVGAGVFLVALLIVGLVVVLFWDDSVGTTNEEVVDEQGAEIPERLPTEPEEDEGPYACTSESGNTMTFDEAFEIAAESACALEGKLQDAGSCNVDTGTWWINLEVDKSNCYPACVVNIEDNSVEINWRCTGLLVEEE